MYTGSAATVLSPTARVAVPHPARTRLHAIAVQTMPPQAKVFPQPFETAPLRRFPLPLGSPAAGPEPALSAPIVATGTIMTENPQKSRRSEEHTSELQAIMRKSNAGFCLKKKINNNNII